MGKIPYPLAGLENAVCFGVGPGRREDAPRRRELEVRVLDLLVVGRLGNRLQRRWAQPAEVAALDQNIVVLLFLAGGLGRRPHPHVLGDLGRLRHGVHLGPLLVEQVDDGARQVALRVHGHDVAVPLLKLPKRIQTNKGIVFGDRVVLGLVLLAPLRLGRRDLPTQLPHLRGVVSVDDNIGRHGRLGRLDLEISYREALPRVYVDELAVRGVGLQEFVGSNGPLQAGHGKIAIGLDHRDASQARRRLPQGFPPRYEKGLLNVIVRV